MPPRPPSARDHARELIAQRFDAMGPEWRNTAGLVRSGYENLWLKPALDAMVPLVLHCRDAEDDEASARPQDLQTARPRAQGRGA